MNEELIETTVTWLKYTGYEKGNLPVIKNNINIIKKDNITTYQYKKIYREIGFNYNWISRLKLSEEELKKIIHHENVDIYFMVKKNKIIGFLEIDYRSLKEVKIVHLGIVDSFIGKGYGKKLLKFAIKRSKEIDIKPLILQTNSLDHPNALIFYQKNGFQVYARRSAKVIKGVKKYDKFNKKNKSIYSN
ncbi:MAG: GNAT family N-acetyltransferase [Pseudomonadota bacterium]|nr:GNAT family N-acetyltransferase [Pseudomonadota bacterium]